MMKPSTFGFLVVRGVRNLGKHWAMTIACIASLSVCMTLNTFATLAEVNVDSMVNYLGQQNEMGVYVDPEADDATIQSVGERITATPGVSRVQYMSKEDVLNQYRGYMADYAVLLDEFENDNPFKANYRVSLADLSQMQANIETFQTEAPLDAAEWEALTARGQRMTSTAALPCTACRYCVTHCPQGLDIPDLLALYNEHRFTGGGFIAPMVVGTLPEDKRPGACVGCRSCEAVCPQRIRVSEVMADFAAKLK